MWKFSLGSNSKLVATIQNTYLYGLNVINTNMLTDDSIAKLTVYIV